MSDHDDDTRHEEAHEEPWLVSYADLMTLLFGFFVLMYTFAIAKLKEDDTDSMEKVRKELSEYFGGEYVTPYEKLAEDFKKGIKGTELGKAIVTKSTPEGLYITIRSTMLFSSGSATLFPQAQAIIENLAKMLMEKSGKLRVVVEGHTDDEPIRHSSVFPSNWELSGARASSVVRIFEQMGFNRTLLASIGYSDTRPEQPNRDANGVRISENMAKNRRVTIKISDESSAIGPKEAKVPRKKASESAKNPNPEAQSQPEALPPSEERAKSEEPAKSEGPPQPHKQTGKH